MMKINNREEIIEQLAELLKQFDKDCNDYQTDVYMYVDEQGNGTLDTFVNVGGNSWLNDDHYTIYSDKPHYEAYAGHYDNDSVRDFAELLEISVEQLEQETRDFLGFDSDDPVNSSDVFSFLTSEGAEKYSEKLQANYEERVEECSPDYVETAEEIFENFESEEGE